jgi:hypothetical protein
VSRLYPLGLALAGAVVALELLLPYKAVPFDRGDGTTVLVPNLSRLSHTADTWDYLQEGRALYRGEGFSSLFTYVPHLGSHADLHPEGLRVEPGPLDPDCFPVLWRQPLFPFMIAGAFALAGSPHPDAVLWLLAAGVVLIPLATYFLGRRLLSPGWAALAGLWALLSPLLLAVPSPMAATTWFAAFFAVVVGVLLRVRRARGWIFLGLLIGIAELFRMDTWILLPGLLVMFLLSRDAPGRIRATVMLLLVFAAVCLPWFILQDDLAGDGFRNTTSLIYHNTQTFPGWTSSRTLAVQDLSAWEFIRDHPREVLAKSVRNLLRYGRDFAILPSPLLAPLLWFAVLRKGTNARSRAFLTGGVVAAATALVVLSPMEYSARFLAPLAPLMTVGAALGLAALPRFRGLLAGAATVVGLVMVTVSLAGRPTDGSSRVAAEDLRSLMATAPDLRSPQGPADPWIFSDAPTVLAWIWEPCGVVWMPVASDVPGLCEWSPGSVAAFTRAGGTTGDGLESDLVERYLAHGGVASAPAKPLVVTWPEPE